MDSKTAMMVGAAAALAAGPALAAPSAAEAPARLVAASYADLLQPIPNAVERLKMADAEAAGSARLIPAQWFGRSHHHHHHHHHHSSWWYRRNGYYWSGRGWLFRPVPHHHHHHHHHHSNY